MGLFLREKGIFEVEKEKRKWTQKSFSPSRWETRMKLFRRSKKVFVVMSLGVFSSGRRPNSGDVLWIIFEWGHSLYTVVINYLNRSILWSFSARTTTTTTCIHILPLSIIQRETLSTKCIASIKLTEIWRKISHKKCRLFCSTWTNIDYYSELFSKRQNRLNAKRNNYVDYLNHPVEIWNSYMWLHSLDGNVKFL